MHLYINSQLIQKCENIMEEKYIFETATLNKGIYIFELKNNKTNLSTFEKLIIQ